MATVESGALIAGTAPTVTHLSASVRVRLADVFGGTESARMTPEIAAHISVLNEPLSCWMVEDDAATEVNALEKSLDILATAELPGSGAQVQVAIENQYGRADPDHFGRLVGWYLPETGAEMGVLIAEDFPPQLLKAVGDGRIVRPVHGLWLIEAAGYVVDGRPAVHYSTRACSLERLVRIEREQVFRRGPGGGGAGGSDEAFRRAARLFDHIARTSTRWLGEAIRKSSQTSGLYRTIEDNGDTCHVALFVGVDRISVGSGYRKLPHDDETVERLATANAEVQVTPDPDDRQLRSSWWHLMRGLGRGTPEGQLPDRLGEEIEAAIDQVRPALEAHQRALKDAVLAPADGPSDVPPRSDGSGEHVP